MTPVAQKKTFSPDTRSSVLEHPIKVVAAVDGLLAFLIVLGGQLCLDRPAHAADRRGGDDALRCAADSGQQVGAGIRPARRDRAGHVTVGDQPDPRAGGADIGDQLFVARPVQDAHRQVGHRRVLRLRDAADVLTDRRGDVDRVDGVGTDGDLVHVEHRRRVEHRAAFGHRQHRDGVRHALGHQGGAVDRVDGEVAVRAVSVADLLTVVEHRGVVLLALADHHHPAHRHRVDQLAHRVDRGAVAALLVAAAHPASGGHRARLGDPDQFQGEVAIGGFAAAGVRHPVIVPEPRSSRPDLGYWTLVSTRRSRSRCRRPSGSRACMSPALRLPSLMSPALRLPSLMSPALRLPAPPSPGCSRTAGTCSGRWRRW